MCETKKRSATSERWTKVNPLMLEIGGLRVNHAEVTGVRKVRKFAVPNLGSGLKLREPQR